MDAVQAKLKNRNHVINQDRENGTYGANGLLAQSNAMVASKIVLGLVLRVAVPVDLKNHNLAMNRNAVSKLGFRPGSAFFQDATWNRLYPLN